MKLNYFLFIILFFKTANIYFLNILFIKNIKSKNIFFKNINL